MPTFNQSEFADLTGYTRQQVATWIKEGMPAESGRQGRGASIESVTALSWLRERWSAKSDPGADTECNQRDRLAKEQADRIALANAVTRGELVYMEHVEQIILEANVLLAGQLDGVAGRLANELAGITSAAQCREIILADHRRIRSAFAAAMQRVADACDRAAENLEGDPSAEEENTERVG